MNSPVKIESDELMSDNRSAHEVSTDESVSQKQNLEEERDSVTIDNVMTSGKEENQEKCMNSEPDKTKSDDCDPSPTESEQLEVAVEPNSFVIKPVKEEIDTNESNETNIEVTPVSLSSGIISNDDRSMTVVMEKSVPIKSNMGYRSKRGSDNDSGTADSDADSVGISDTSNDSSDSDSGNEPSSSSEAEDILMGRYSYKRQNVRNNDADEDDEDFADETIKNNGGKVKPIGNVRTKGEFALDDLPTLDQLKITLPEDVSMEEIGSVSCIIDVLVIIQAARGKPALDADTFVFLEGQRVIGQIFETLGPVLAPLYSIRFNSEEHIKDLGVEVGMPVYVVPLSEQFTRYVFVEQLRRLKGSDASWEHNNEPPDRFLDYSDDEQERKAKAKSRTKDISADDEQTEEGNDTDEIEGKKKRKRKPRPIGDREGGYIQKSRGFRGGRGHMSQRGNTSQRGNSSQRGNHHHQSAGSHWSGSKNYRPRHPQYSQFPSWPPRGSGHNQRARGHPLGRGIRQQWAYPPRGPTPPFAWMPPPPHQGIPATGLYTHGGAPSPCPSVSLPAWGGAPSPGPAVSVPSWAIPAPPNTGQNVQSLSNTSTYGLSSVPLDTRFIQNSSGGQSKQSSQPLAPGIHGPVYPAAELGGLGVTQHSPAGASQFGASPSFPSAPQHTWTAPAFPYN